MPLRSSRTIIAYATPLLGIALFAYTQLTPHYISTHNPEIFSSPAVYDKDFTDIKVFTGAFHNIFVGKVIQELEGTTRNDFPTSRFQVQVLSVVKGNVSGVVTVAQLGGLRDGKLLVMQGDMPGTPTRPSNNLLQPGSTYLLATRGDGTEGYYLLGTNGYAKQLISSNPNLSIATLASLADNNPRIQALKVAYPNETPMNEDVLHNFTLNSFTSLPEDKKAEALLRATQAKASLEASQPTPPAVQ